VAMERKTELLKTLSISQISKKTVISDRDLDLGLAAIGYIITSIYAGLCCRNLPEHKLRHY
jgi:hypothetical protein